jgi:hypothetical protein
VVLGRRSGRSPRWPRTSGPVDSTAKAICCGPARQFATFHGDDPEQAVPVLEQVCNQATIMEQPATTAQPPSNEVDGVTGSVAPSSRGSYSAVDCALARLAWKGWSSLTLMV